VRHLRELHGGTVSAESGGRGRGARFTVRLPIALGGGRRGEPAPRRSLPRRRRTDGCWDLRLLLVEDHRDTADLMRTVLERHGAGARGRLAGRRPSTPCAASR
jgi:hypothetical protein